MEGVLIICGILWLVIMLRPVKRPDYEAMKVGASEERLKYIKQCEERWDAESR